MHNQKYGQFHDVQIRNEKVKISATDLIIIITIIVYIFDKYFIKGDDILFDEPTIFDVIIGFCGGRLYTLLSFTGAAYEGELWRVVTYLFVHFFILHLLVNMISLYIAGNFVEKSLGSIATILLYFLIGIIGVLIIDNLPYINSTNSIAGGASISVFGMIGVAFSICILRCDSRYSIKKSKRVFLAVYGIVFTYFMGIWTMCAHNLGFILGLLLGLSFVSIKKRLIVYEKGQ